MNRAVFLDRDGVIIREPPYYPHKLVDLHLLPRVDQAIRRLNENRFKVVVISNQSGIARGYYSEAEALIFNAVMVERLKEMGAMIDAIYFCPHYPKGTVSRYSTECECRKPAPGMLIRAGKELDIDLDMSFMVGDKDSDLECGRRVNCSTVLIQSRNGYQKSEYCEHDCNYIADDLFRAVDYILSRQIILSNSKKGPE